MEAPVHLAALLIPHLLKQKGGAIVNITSGLAFAPLARAPVYSATKAALHSFTLSLRHQASQLPLQAIEIAPPAVDTDLGGPGLHTWGVNVDEFVDAVMPRLEAGELEIGYGFSDETRRALRLELDEVFNVLISGRDRLRLVLEDVPCRQPEEELGAMPGLAPERQVAMH